MAAMPRDSGQQQCERKTRSRNSSISNFVDSLLPSSSSLSSASSSKKTRFNNNNNFEESTLAASMNSLASMATALDNNSNSPQTSVSVQQFLASSALSALVFGGGGVGIGVGNLANQLEKYENGNRSMSGADSLSPLPLSGRSSTIAEEGFDDPNSMVVPTFLSNDDDEECSPPPGGATMSANGDANGNYFACVHCNKYFWTETSLKHHSSLYHSEKSFICEICGKAFRFRSNLAEHRSVHTSLKPYVCKFCGKSSRLKGNLTKHILKHHKKEQNAYIGKDDIIIKKGKKSVKDPAAVDFLEKSMIVLTSSTSPLSIISTSTIPKQTTTTSTATATATAISTSIPISMSPSSICGQFSTSAIDHAPQDLGSAAMQLLSMASKTETKPILSTTAPSSRSTNKRKNSNPSSSSTINKSKSEKQNQQQRMAESIFGNNESPILVSSKSPRFSSPANSNSPVNAGKSISPIKDQNRFSINDDFLDINFLHSTNAASDNGPTGGGGGANSKFDYDELFSSISNKINQPRADVDSIFESLLGRNLANRDSTARDIIDYSPQPMLDDFTSSPILNLTTTTNQQQAKSTTTNQGVGTRCQLCGKHFRKSTNLAVHMSIKHNQQSSSQAINSNRSIGADYSPISPTINAADNSDDKYPSIIESIGQVIERNQSISRESPIDRNQGVSIDRNQPISIDRHQSILPSKSTQSLIKSDRSKIDYRPVGASATSIPPKSIIQSTSSLQFDALNGLMTKSGVSKDLKEIRNVLQELKRGLPDVAKLDELLSALDARVDRLERQLETSVNTLYILVQMQTDMNSAFCQFKNDVVERLKSLKSQHDDVEVDDDDDEEEEEEVLQELEEDEGRI